MAAGLIVVTFLRSANRAGSPPQCWYDELGKQSRHQHSAYTEEPTERPIGGSKRGDHDEDQNGHAASNEFDCHPVRSIACFN
jgi:hypothetical protein